MLVPSTPQYSQGNQLLLDCGYGLATAFSGWLIAGLLKID
jgi:hypothetical protein